MVESSFLTVIRIWAAMAWADGRLAIAEGEALRRLIDGAELDDAERDLARGFLHAPVDLDDAALAALSLDSRRGIYRAACRVAALDREVAASERDLLTRLRDRMALPGDEAKEIERSILPA